MSYESLEGVGTLKERIEEALLGGSRADSLICLRELYQTLTGEDEVSEEAELIFEALPDFLDDSRRASFIIPLEAGGRIHVTIFREGGTLSFQLSTEAGPEVQKRFKQLGLTHTESSQKQVGHV